MVVAVLVVLAVGIGLYAGLRSDDTPISGLSCSELAATERRIQDDLAPDADFDTSSQAAKDAQELNDRVDALGGCPDEPDLQ